MKHPANREFYAYWDGKRAGAAAPERGDFEPGQVRHLLGDIFVLACDASAGYPFRVAGTRLCALLHRDLKNASFADLFHRIDREEMLDILGIVTEEQQATVAGITARVSDGTEIHFELLLLPFSARWKTPLSLTGLLAPLENHPKIYDGLTDFGVTTWRHIIREHRGPRELRKWSVIRGLTVYEGLR